MKVPQLVPSNAGNAHALPEFLEIPHDAGLLHEPAVPMRKYKLAVAGLDLGILMAPENLDRQLVQINDPHSRSGLGGVHNHALVMSACDVLNHLQAAFLEVDVAPPERQGFAATHSGMDKQMDEREERMLLPFSQLQEVADGLNIRRHHLEDCNRRGDSACRSRSYRLLYAIRTLSGDRGLGKKRRLGQKRIRRTGLCRISAKAGHHLYRCPAGGCSRLGQLTGYATCGDESWEDPAPNIRLFGSKIRRASREWALKYAKRWSVERLFSRWKYPGRLERHCYMGLAKIRMHALLQMLVSLSEETAEFTLSVQLPLFPSPETVQDASCD